MLCIAALCFFYQFRIATVQTLSSSGTGECTAGGVQVGEDMPSSLLEPENVSGSGDPLDEATEPDRGRYPDGVFTGKGEGYGGMVTVEVVVEEGWIDKITVLDSSSEDGPYLRDAKGIIPKVLEAQDTNLDAISGATHSTWGILNAVDDALANAG